MTKTDLAEGLAAVRREMATKGDGLARLREDLKNHELADLKRELREDIAGMGHDLGGSSSRRSARSARDRVRRA